MAAAKAATFPTRPHWVLTMAPRMAHGTIIGPDGAWGDRGLRPFQRIPVVVSDKGAWCRPAPTLQESNTAMRSTRDIIIAVKEGHPVAEDELRIALLVMSAVPSPAAPPPCL